MTETRHYLDRLKILLATADSTELKAEALALIQQAIESLRSGHAATDNSQHPRIQEARLSAHTAVVDEVVAMLDGRVLDDGTVEVEVSSDGHPFTMMVSITEKSYE